MLQKLKIYVSLTTLIVLAHSCTPEELLTKGFKMDEINPEYAIPLVSDNLTLEKLLGDGFSFDGQELKVYPDGSLSLISQGQIASSYAMDVITIPDQSFSQSITLNAMQAGILGSGQPLTISLQTANSFAMGSREIDSILFKAGSLAGSISSDIKTGGNLKITFEDAKNLHLILTVDIPFSYNGSTPVVANASRLLAGYRWNMTKGSPGYNNVNIKFDLTLNSTTEPVVAGEKMDITMGFTQMKFSRFYGYIGQVNLLNGGDTIDLPIFDNAKEGTFYLEDPKVKIKCGSSYGVPVKAGFTKLAGYTNGTETNITPLTDPLPIKTPTMAQIGMMVYDSVTLDKTTSNINTVINKGHKQIVFQAYIDLNPGGKLQRNFITDYSQMKFIIDIEIPFHGNAKNFAFETEKTVDEAGMKGGLKLPNGELLQKVTIRYTAINGFPIDLFTQIYLMDSLGVTFDSIFSEKLYKFIEAAPVGTDGKVNGTTKKTTDVIFDMDRARRLSRLDKVKIRAEIGTTSAGGTYPSVKLYNNYVMGIKLGVKAKLKFDSDVLDSLGGK
ncbi:MAG: hypothetical protein ACKVQB_13000 [Bacteroidia bacterium]